MQKNTYKYELSLCNGDHVSVGSESTISEILLFNKDSAWLQDIETSRAYRMSSIIAIKLVDVSYVIV